MNSRVCSSARQGKKLSINCVTAGTHSRDGGRNARKVGRGPSEGGKEGGDSSKRFADEVRACPPKGNDIEKRRNGRRGNSENDAAKRSTRGEGVPDLRGFQYARSSRLGVRTALSDVNPFYEKVHAVSDVIFPTGNVSAISPRSGSSRIILC